MNVAEAAKLLTIASGFDNRVVDELKAAAWSAALDDVSFAEGQNAVIAHFKDSGTRHDYLTVGHVLDRVESAKRLSRAAIEADVRSAKARGLIDRSWPDRGALPDDVRDALARARLSESVEIRELAS